MKACRPSIALYQALIDAHVSTETATAAALSIEEDINSVTANLATRQDILQSLQALKVSFPKWDNKLAEFETQCDAGMARCSGLQSKTACSQSMGFFGSH
jgi:hypothetical protein